MEIGMDINCKYHVYDIQTFLHLPVNLLH